MTNIVFAPPWFLNMERDCNMREERGGENIKTKAMAHRMEV